MCVRGAVQVTTQQWGIGVVAEAVTFAPDTEIDEMKDDEGKVISRKLVKINFNK